MSRTTRRATLSATIIATGALLLSGCSSSSAGTSAQAAPSASASASGGAQQSDAYQQCLSQHGVKAPSGRPSGRPSGAPGGGRPSGQPGGGFGGGRSADPAFQQAAQACASLRPQGDGDGPAGASAINAFTSCMKDHGVVLPSASPGSKGNALGDLSTSDTKTAQAYTACKALLPTGQPAATASPSS